MIEHPACYRHLARAILDQAFADLRSESASLHDDSLRFFHGGMCELVCDVAEIPYSDVCDAYRSMESVRAERILDKDPKSRKTLSIISAGRLMDESGPYPTYRHIQLFLNGIPAGWVKDRNVASKISGVSVSWVAHILKHGGKTKDGFSFIRMGKERPPVANNQPIAVNVYRDGVLVCHAKSLLVASQFVGKSIGYVKSHLGSSSQVKGWWFKEAKKPSVVSKASTASIERR